MNKQQIISGIEKAGVSLVRFIYCDNAGIIRGKVCPVDHLKNRLETGFGVSVAQQAVNMMDRLIVVDGFLPVGEIALVPDLDSFKILPYAKQSAAFICDMLTLDRNPWNACPRHFLNKMIKKAEKEFDLKFQVSFENEFTLFKKNEQNEFLPLDEGNFLSTTSMIPAADIVLDFIDKLKKQNIDVNAYYPEAGHGQHELPIEHSSPLQAADNHIWFKETIRNVAFKHNLVASFAAKPAFDQPGNGCHVHISAWDLKGKENLFSDRDDRYNLSKPGYHFIAGILKHLPGLIALTAPTVNSYRRLQPHCWSSAYSCWGPDNREAAIRIVSPLLRKKYNTVNIEYKPCDPGNNSYLALGGLIAAGLDGIKHKLLPGKPVLTDPGLYREEERKKLGIKRLPENLDAALTHLENNDMLRNALGNDLSRSFLTVKRSEVQLFSSEDSDYEIKHHFYKF